MKNIFRLVVALIIAAALLLAPRTQATSTDGGGPSWPTNPTEAAARFGIEGQRSAQADQWNSCTGEGTTCWSLTAGATTELKIRFGDWIEGFAAGNFGPIDGPWKGTAEGASIRQVENPDRPLSRWPASKEEAARAFGLRGQRSSDPTQWMPCDGEPNCWSLKGGTPTGVYAPVGSNLQGSLGDWNFGPMDGPQAEILDGATLRSRMLARHTVYLPLVHNQRAPKGDIVNWPQTPGEAAETFGVSGQRSANPRAWEKCPGEELICWRLIAGSETSLDIGKGAWIQGSNAAGTIPPTLTPWSGKAEGASLRLASTFPN